MKKYIVFYLLWLIFISIITISLAMTTSEFSMIAMDSAEAGENTFYQVWDILTALLTFRVTSFTGIMTTLLIYVPAAPLMIWLGEKALVLLGIITPDWL